MIQLTPKQRRIAQFVGFPLLAIIAFVFALAHTFPYERLKEKIVDAVAYKYDLTISEIEPTFLPGGIVLKSVTLQDRPEDPEQVPSLMYFDEIVIDVGVLSLLFGNLDVDLLAETTSGTIEGSFSANALRLDKADDVEVELTTENIQLAGLPGVREGVGLPVSGGLNAELKLSLPGRKFSEAEGYFRFSCSNCSIGDGVSKIKPRLPESKRNNPRYQRQLAMYGDGLTVPLLQLGATEASVAIKKGVGTIEKLHAISPDGELAIEGKINFADPFKDSRLPGCLRFRISEELKKREKDFGNIDLILDAKRDDDGFFSFPTEGTLTNLRWNTKKPCKGIGSDQEDEASDPSRPRITTRPTVQPSDTESIRRAAGKDADEPEVSGVRASGPALDGKDEGNAGVERGDSTGGANGERSSDDVGAGAEARRDRRDDIDRDDRDDADERDIPDERGDDVVDESGDPEGGEEVIE